MKRLRILLTSLLLACSGTVFAFAEAASGTAKKDIPWEIIVIVVVLALIAYNEIKASKRRREKQNEKDGSKEK